MNLVVVDGKMKIELNVEAVVSMHVHVDEETGRRYSHNAATGQTEWLSDDDEENHVTEGGERKIELDVEAVVTMHVDEETGRRYNYNAATGHTQWLFDDDEKDGATHEEEPGEGQQESSSTRRILYRKIVGDDNAVFFQNVETSETVWTMPKNGDLVP